MIFNLVTLGLSILAVVINIVNYDKATQMVPDVLWAFASGIIVYYVINYIQGFIATVFEWNHIHASGSKKLLYTLTYPIYMCTYIPMSFVAIFAKIKWKPIEHTNSSTIDDIEELQQAKATPISSKTEEYTYVTVQEDYQEEPDRYEA